MEDLIVRTISRTLVPFIQVYGLYIILHGHLTPGGSFSGGAVLGSSMILFALSFNLERGAKKLSHDASTVLECGGILIFAMLGFYGILAGTNFLTNLKAGFYPGVPGEFFSAGFIIFITVALAFKVASTVITLFYNLIETEGEAHD